MRGGPAEEATCTAARSPRERILAMATAAAELEEPRRRYAVLGLIRERYRSVVSAVNAGEMPCSQAEVFQASPYGDADGRAYWAAWLFPREEMFPGKTDAEALAHLVATHAVRSAEELERIRGAVEASLAAAPGTTAREMVAHLVADPDVSRFVPVALRDIVTGSAAAGPTAMPRSSAESTSWSRPTKRRTGPAPVERDRVVAAMRAAHAVGTIDILSPKTKNVVLEVMFAAKRTTVCAARKAFEAEIAGITGRQTPVNGK